MKERKGAWDKRALLKRHHHEITSVPICTTEGLNGPSCCHPAEELEPDPHQLCWCTDLPADTQTTANIVIVLLWRARCLGGETWWEAVSQKNRWEELPSLSLREHRGEEKTTCLSPHGGFPAVKAHSYPRGDEVTLSSYRHSTLVQHMAIPLHQQHWAHVDTGIK